MRDFLNHGLLSIFVPVQGYIVLPTKMINITSTLISFYYYPEVSYTLTIIFTLSVIVAIAFSPTELRWRWLCAVLTLLIPTDPEAFGVSLMAFWWGGILAILALLWNRSGKWRGLQVAYVVFGGFSAPVIVGLTPLFWLRALLERRRADALVAGLATGVAVVQTILVLGHPSTATSNPLKIADVFVFVEKYFGYFTVYSFADWPYTLAAAVVMLGLLAYGCWIALFRREFYFLIAVLTIFALAGLSSLRQTPAITHPILAGPRYYFYPYIVLSWALVWMIVLAKPPIKPVVMAAIALALANATGHFARYHQHLDWRAHLDRCLRNEEPGTQRIPIHFAGLTAQPADLWFIDLTRQECERLVGRGLIGP